MPINYFAFFSYRIHHEKHEKCFVCKTKLSKSLLEEHIKAKHEFYLKHDLAYGIVDDQFGQNNPEEKRYQCNQCDKNYLKRGTLIQHIETIHHFLKHQCAKCGQIFKATQGLRTHINVQHGEEKEKCHICGKLVFKSRLENHIKEK